jgi:hypothetical protein
MDLIKWKSVPARARERERGCTGVITSNTHENAMRAALRFSPSRRAQILDRFRRPPSKKRLHDTMADCVMSLGYTRASIPDSCSYIKWWHPLSLLRSSFPTPNIVVNSYIEAAAKLLFQFLISTVICICGINLLGFPTDHYRATKWVDPLQRPTHLPLSNAAATNLPVVFPPFFPLHCSLINPL